MILKLASPVLFAIAMAMTCAAQDRTLRPAVECHNIAAAQATGTGISYSDRGLHKLALESYQIAIQLDPTCAAGYLNLGAGYAKLERHAEALQAYQKALQFKPSWAWIIHSNMGRSYSLLDQPDNAYKSYSEVIKLRPKEASVYFSRAILNLKSGRGEEAASDARAFLKLKGLKNERGPYVALFAYIGYRRAKQDSSAGEILEEVLKSGLKKWPGPVFQYLKGELNEKELLERARDEDQIAESRAYIGLELVMSGKTTEAIPHLNWVKEHGSKKLIEFKLAVAELERINTTKTN